MHVALDKLDDDRNTAKANDLQGSCEVIIRERLKQFSSLQPKPPVRAKGAFTIYFGRKGFPWPKWALSVAISAIMMAVMTAGGSYGCSLHIIDLCYPGTHPYLLGHIRGRGSKHGKPLRAGDSCTESSRRVCSVPSCELRPASRTPHLCRHHLHRLPSHQADLQRDNGRSSKLWYTHYGL